MANICDQSLYLVAQDEEAMKALLARMARNLGEATGTNPLTDVEAGTTWRAQAETLDKAAWDYNRLCLISGKPDTVSEGGWVSFGVVDGKPGFAIHMNLKWGPSNQLQGFCESLGEGYGYASVNGGEYMCAMGDELCFIQCGPDFGGAMEGACDFERYATWKRKALKAKPATLHDIALQELFSRELASSLFWSHGEEEPSIPSVSPSSNSMPVRPTLNWGKPRKTDLEGIDLHLAGVLEKFPWILLVTGSAYEGREANVEDLVPGEPVKLVSDWKSPYFTPVGIEVHTADGRSIGNLDCAWWDGGVDLEDNDRAAIACILPHVRAYAEQVVPLSTKDGRARHSTVTVRLELDDQNPMSIFEDMHATLRKGPAKRSLSSLPTTLPKPTGTTTVPMAGVGADAGGAESPEHEADPLLDALEELTSGIPESERPRSIAALIRAFPDYAGALQARKKQGALDKDTLVERGILGLTQAQQKARKKALRERCVRNASVAELGRYYLGCGGAPLVKPGEGEGLLRPGVIGMDVAAGVELRETTFASMRSVEVEPGDTLKVRYTEADTWGFEKGIALSAGRKQVALVPRSHLDTFVTGENMKVATPLAKWANSEVMDCAYSDGHSIALIAHSFLHPISTETLLYALHAMGAISDEELLGGDAWRTRLEAMPE